MGRIRYTIEDIIQHLRTAEIEQGKGLTQEQAAKKIGVTVTTLVRWKKEFGGLKLDQAKRLKQLERGARGAKRGLWADPHAVPPWEWRVMRKRYR